MNDLLLREICELTGVTRRAIQGYEKAGLITPTGKTKHGYLLYNETLVPSINKIKLFQDRGFSLKEIKSFENLTKEDFKFILIQKVFELKMEQTHLEQVTSDIQTIISEL